MTELYAIICALKEWTYLLLGAEHLITVHCDHKNLTYYCTPQHLTARQVRWWNNLSRYPLQSIHVAGTKLVQADALSHRPDHTNGEEDTEEVTMLPGDLFIQIIAEDRQDQINLATQSNEFAFNITECLSKKSTLPLRSALSDWMNDDRIILYKGKAYIPADTDLR